MIYDAYKIVLHSTGVDQRGDYAYLHEGTSLLIGRASRHSKADFPIFNSFVSREHCILSLENGRLYIEDLNSKHGTALNGNPLLPQTRYALIEGDRITLVNGLIELYIDRDDQVTREMDITDILPRHNVLLNDTIQTIHIDDAHIKMPQKEYACFKLLFNNLGNPITKEEIIQTAWTERIGNPNHLVADEEISSLIYRVRKRVKQRFTITSIPHTGYYMEMV
ncbi:MAG: FHA domain-containing protein [Bacillus sp. (in: firmicutes)]